jgi:hypothetical protein
MQELKDRETECAEECAALSEYLIGIRFALLSLRDFRDRVCVSPPLASTHFGRFGLKQNPGIEGCFSADSPMEFRYWGGYLDAASEKWKQVLRKSSYRLPWV